VFVTERAQVLREIHVCTVLPKNLTISIHLQFTYMMTLKDIPYIRMFSFIMRSKIGLSVLQMFVISIDCKFLGEI